MYPLLSDIEIADAPPHSLREGIRPVVILGAGRSGTKFLRQLIASSRACAAIPYGVSYAWRYGNERLSHDALPAPACTPRIARHIRASLLRLSPRPASGAPPYLVEKTCANTLRVAFVDAVLPDARYVHLVRDGRDVAVSALRRWTAAPDPADLFKKLLYLATSDLTLSSIRFVGTYVGNWMRGLLHGRAGLRTWGPRYPGMAEDVARRSRLEVCAWQWRTCVECALHDLRALAAERTLLIRYEELVRDPHTVERLCSFLQLPDPDAVHRHYQNTVRRDAVGKGKRTLSTSALDEIAPIVRPTLERLGYE